jgi:hypothetical protein
MLNGFRQPRPHRITLVEYRRTLPPCPISWFPERGIFRNHLANPRSPAADALDGTIIVYAGAKDRLLDTGVSCGVKSVGNGKAAQGGCSAEQAILSIVDMFIGVLDFDDDDARQCALRSI